MSAVLDQIREHKAEILASATKHGIKDVAVFGSVARGEDVADSDIDLLIDVLPDSEPFGFVRFQREMENLFKKKVDIVFRQKLFRMVAPHILQDAIPVV